MIYSSDLVRAYDTAKEIAQSFDLKVTTDQRLREINQGLWEGMHFPDIKKKFAEEFAKRQEDPINISAPGGETVGQVRDRVLAAINEFLAQHGQDERIAIVCHGFVIAVIRVYFGNIPIEQVWDYIPGNTEIIRLESNLINHLS